MRKLKLILMGVLLFTANTLLAQTREVTGKVTDANGSPLSGVSIKVKGTNTGTFTGDDGNFKVSLPKGLSSLVFSSIGFDDQEVDVKGGSVNITLTQSAKSLNEVVVVGYGTQIKRDITSVI
jgi:hypothetical protein